ncbi:MAG: hypothetical protein AB1815_02245 [Bacillota bacterium]
MPDVVGQYRKLQRHYATTPVFPSLIFRSFITELIRPKTPASVGGGFQRAVKSSMDSANIQRGLNPPLNEVSFKARAKNDKQCAKNRGFLWL